MVIANVKNIFSAGWVLETVIIFYITMSIWKKILVDEAVSRKALLEFVIAVFKSICFIYLKQSADQPHSGRGLPMIF